MEKVAVGIGLRTRHIPEILSGTPGVDWIEALTENFLGTEGRLVRALDEISARHPVVLHGVSLGLGNPGPLDRKYVGQVRDLARRCRATMISDHLCWTGIPPADTHQLLPLPYTEESFRYVARRVRTVQDLLEAPLVVENPASYLALSAGGMSEPEFLGRLAAETGCGLLIDVANVWITTRNQASDPLAYLRALPGDPVRYYHVAGFSRRGRLLLDSHVGPVPEVVWSMYRHACRIIGPRPTAVEWDITLPPLQALCREALRARKESRMPPGPLPPPPRRRAAKPSRPGVRLAPMQRWVHDQIVRGRSSRARAGAFLRSLHGSTLEARVGIYRTSLPEKVEASLSGDFRGIERILGERRFLELLRAYLKRHPPRGRSLRRAGWRMAAFLSRRPLLRDVAAVEIAQMQVYDAPSVPTVTAAALASIPPDEWPGLRLRPVPALRLLALRTPAVPALEAAALGRPIPRATRPSWVAIHRKDFEVRRRELSESEYGFYRSLARGNSVARAAKAGRVPVELVRAWLAEGAEGGFFTPADSGRGSAARRPSPPVGAR